ncbi:MAG: FGGY family carbohydrate kinase, partial [Candidatus Latescibacteria bacterium]|nr:FGGY family carbohydrate kinase [Candidatus Latescibacterota bacterium]
MSLLGVDVGTSGTKAVAFDEEGHPIASSYREYPLHSPQRGWLELDPYEVEAALGEVLSEVALATKTDPITALSVSSQGEAAVPIAKDGTYLCNVQVSLDERTDPIKEWWRERIDPMEMFRITGHTIHSIYTLSR